MLDEFVNSLAANTATVLIWSAALGSVILLVLFLRARQRRVKRLLGDIRKEIPLTSRMKEALAAALNVNTAEVTTVGAVTFADIALQYSMADPTIWDHFDGPAADHMADAIQNLDVLRESLGSYSTQFFHNVVESLKQVEALHVFNDLAEHMPLLENAGAGTAIAVEASGQSLVDSLAKVGTIGGELKANTAGSLAESATGPGLLNHLPLITIGFATYRAWRRSQKGTEMKRNLEFAGIEVATRAGGGLIGGQIGGVIGTAIVPGIGTIIGGVAGAVAGTLSGMWLGEDIKKRHVKKARETFDMSLSHLGRVYLSDPVHFKALTNVFVENEHEYTNNLKATRQRLIQYSLPWRMVWPDEKLILLQETVRLAEGRLSNIKQGTVDAVDRLNYMRQTEQDHELGVILWSNPALRDQLQTDAEIVRTLELAHDNLRHELIQLEGTEGAVA